MSLGDRVRVSRKYVKGRWMGSTEGEISTVVSGLSWKSSLRAGWAISLVISVNGHRSPLML